MNFPNPPAISKWKSPLNCLKIMVGTRENPRLHPLREPHLHPLRGGVMQGCPGNVHRQCSTTLGYPFKKRWGCYDRKVCSGSRAWVEFMLGKFIYFITSKESTDALPLVFTLSLKILELCHIDLLLIVCFMKISGLILWSSPFSFMTPNKDNDVTHGIKKSVLIWNLKLKIS